VGGSLVVSLLLLPLFQMLKQRNQFHAPSLFNQQTNLALLLCINDLAGVSGRTCLFLVFIFMCDVVFANYGEHYVVTDSTCSQSLFNQPVSIPQYCAAGCSQSIITVVLLQGPCPTQAGTGTLAYAGQCRTDQYDRPIIGFVNFCPYQISVASQGTASFNSQLATAVHEIVHALGFTSDRFAYFRDHSNSGQPYTSRDADGVPNLGDVDLFGGSVKLPSTSTFTTSTERGHTVWKAVTPKVPHLLGQR
jgi:hypothetical protein